MDTAKIGLYTLYWIALLGGCVLILCDQYFWGAIVRAMLMPILGVYMFVSLRPTHSLKLKVFFSVAILFLWVSDLSRIFINSDLNDITKKDSPLLVSLYCSIAASLFNMLAYFKIRKLRPSKAVYASGIVSLGIGFVYYFFYILLRNDKINQFKIPFICYIGSLILSFAFAANIADSDSRKRLGSSYFLPAGLLAFLSGALFIFNRYQLMSIRFDLVVTLAYGYSQLLNINGFRKTSR